MSPNMSLCCDILLLCWVYLPSPCGIKPCGEQLLVFYLFYCRQLGFSINQTATLHGLKDIVKKGLIKEYKPVGRKRPFQDHH